MKRETLAKESDIFAACAEEAQRSSAGDKSAQRQLEASRGSLLRTFIRFCQTLSAGELLNLAEYTLLITM